MLVDVKIGLIGGSVVGEVFAGLRVNGRICS